MTSPIDPQMFPRCPSNVPVALRSGSLLVRSLLLASLLLAAFGQESTEPYRIYLDADQTHLREAGSAIRNGFQTALAEADNKLDGIPVELVVKNHRRNTLRSKLHLQQFSEDPRGLLVLGGVHSPPILASRDWINENGILFLNPWAAAGPITRPRDGHTNWIFRLSVDDTKAGAFMVRHMHEKRALKRPYLLLEETKWGDTNLITLQDALRDADLRAAGVQRFPWHLGEAAAVRLITTIQMAKPDCILFVGNTPEAKTLFGALLKNPKAAQLPVISHWGITAGNLLEGLPETHHQQLDLSFIQTTFSFATYPDDPVGNRVLSRAKSLGVERDVEAPVGFIHAYDLGRILVAAAAQAELTGNALEDRERLRKALESLEQPVEGLVKTYRKPFQTWTPDDKDAHEALGELEMSMGAYERDGQIKLIQPHATYPREP